MKYFSIALLAFIYISSSCYAQNKLTRENVLSMSVEELSDLPLEELMQAVSLLGVSSVDELFSIIMNKSVSAASKKDESAFTAPLSTTSLSRTEMQTYGVTTIEEALRLIPGIIVQEKVNGNFDIHIRGLNNIPDNQMLLYTENSNTLLMIDGRICHNYAFGGIAFDMLPISFADIDHIEVIRGATSVLYGTNAVQGVINIVTQKQSNEDTSVDFAANIGNFSMGHGSAAIRKNFNNKVFAGVSISYMQQERENDKIYIIPNNNIYLGETNFANGGYVDASNLEQMEYRTSTLNAVTNQYIDETYSIIEPNTPSNKMFEKPQLSRDSKIVNGYLTIIPNEFVSINITGGYQNSISACSPISDDYFSINQRSSKTAYGNIDTRIKTLHFNVNYAQGPQNYALGVPGFKEKSQVLGAIVDYDILIGSNLNIRPEVDYQWIRYEDYENNGYFNGSAKITDIAPSISIDYKLDSWRFIGGFRSDKTNIPSKWNHSWQLIASKQINNNNFLRLSYARAMRSANLTNTSANYTWNRENLPLPKVINYIGNEDADIMHIDNFELGYRLRPNDALLIDIEAFYSLSKDFGALQSQSSMLYLTSAQMNSFISDLTEAWTSNTVEQFVNENLGAINENFGSKAIIQYQNLPYETHQMGLSISADWIISPKLIAKININGQHTYIDNYYKYNQAEAIASQLDQSRAKTLESLIGYNGSSINRKASFVDEFTNGLSRYRNTGNDYTQYAHDAIMMIENLEQMQLVDDKDAAQLYKMAYERAVFEGFNILYGQPNVPKFQNESGLAWFDPSTISVNEYLAAYYAIKYDIRNDGSNYYFATQAYKRAQTENKHKHKATPSFYGSVNLVYKPMSQIETSLVCNFMSKREYETLYGTQTLDARFTADLKIGYRPTSSFELYFRGKNLFNTQKQEFVYGDKIGGTYSMGVFIYL